MNFISEFARQQQSTSQVIMGAGTVQMRRRQRSVFIAVLVVAALFAMSSFNSKSPQLITSSNAAATDSSFPFSPPSDSPSLSSSSSPSSQSPPSSTSPSDAKSRSDQCLLKYPWITPALEKFYAATYDSSARSIQTTEESLDHMGNITWMNGYHPGQDVITLTYNPEVGRYTTSIFERWKANQPHKSRCIRMIVEEAIREHGAALAEIFKRKEIKFVVVTEDFGINWAGSDSKLPAFTLCTTENEHSDIPVPDFTYGCYPEAHYTNSSWPAISSLLSTKAAMMPWQERSNTVFHRSNWGVGPRRQLMPVLKRLMNNGSDVDVLGGRLDVADTGFTISKKENFVFLDEQCRHKVAIHTAGFSYSAGLKYKLACASLVLHFDSKYKEFYEPALEDGIHVIRLPATEEGVDEEEFWTKSVPKIKAAVQEAMAVGLDRPPTIAQQGQKFVLEQLTPEALSCYWYGALMRYGDLYFSEETVAQISAKREGRPATMTDFLKKQQEEEEGKNNGGGKGGRKRKKNRGKEEEEEEKTEEGGGDE